LAATLKAEIMMIWKLETNNTAYVIGVNQAGYLLNLHWGARLPDYPSPSESEGYASFNGAGQILPEEYPTYGMGLNYTEPCLKATFSDGVRGVALQFDSAQQTDNTLTLTLKDTHYPLTVKLHYQIYAEQDIIARHVTLINTGDTPITLERAWTARWHFPPGDSYYLHHLTGRWNDEWVHHRERLTNGVKILESRRITTSHHHNPYFAVERGDATETHGEVWFGALAWSGNWKIAAEVTEFQSTRVSIGLNDWDFAWVLEPGETFTSPIAYAGYTQQGLGAASRCLHDLIRKHILPHPDLTRKVLYNSWEATLFDVDEESQKRYAEIAAEIGCELFVMDDGWFHGRNNDTSGLGDWWADSVKFPNGLTPLIEHVNQLGMDFGLWLEPEMVNPNSELYRAHPDWVIHFATRQRTPARNQLILNMARPDVQAYLIEKIDRLLTEHNIRFIKWDMNRNVSEPGWQDAPRDQRELWVRYVHGVYHVWETLKNNHPQVIWQSCSGGGGRADLGILRLADQIWISDNTEPTRRLAMQANFSRIFPPNTMEAWVTDMGEQTIPLAFRFHVSMCGVLGVGANISRWTDAQKAEAAHWINEYKRVRHIIQQGDVFQLYQQDGYYATQYLSQDQRNGVLFAFRTYRPEPTTPLVIRLQGLSPDHTYTINGVSHSGAYWMTIGMTIQLHNFGSIMWDIHQV